MCPSPIFPSSVPISPSKPPISPYNPSASPSDPSASPSGPTASPSDPSAHPNLDALLREVVQRDASDLHLAAGRPPQLRIDGRLTDSESSTPLARDDPHRLAATLIDDRQRKRLDAGAEIDFAFGMHELARFRGACFREQGRVAVVLRRIPHDPPRLGDLGLPPTVAAFARQRRGLVLVTGPSGSGKSTTLAAVVDRINRDRSGHIVTVEDPIEFVHPHRRCIVNQREVGADTRSFASALKHSLRHDPDVILVGEMRDSETMGAALAAAETGHLVLATLHTNSAAESVNRIVDAFSTQRQSQVRTQLAAVLQGVVTQLLLPRAGSTGRVAAAEVMVCTPAVRAVIRDDRVHQIPSLMQAGRKHGMQTLNDALARLYLNGEVELAEVLRHSEDPYGLLRAVGEPPPEGFALAESAGGRP